MVTQRQLLIVICILCACGTCERLSFDLRALNLLSTPKIKQAHYENSRKIQTSSSASWENNNDGKTTLDIHRMRTGQYIYKHIIVHCCRVSEKPGPLSHAQLSISILMISIPASLFSQGV